MFGLPYDKNRFECPRLPLVAQQLGLYPCWLFLKCHIIQLPNHIISTTYVSPNMLRNLCLQHLYNLPIFLCLGQVLNTLKILVSALLIFTPFLWPWYFHYKCHHEYTFVVTLIGLRIYMSLPSGICPFIHWMLVCGLDIFSENATSHICYTLKEPSTSIFVHHV